MKLLKYRRSASMNEAEDERKSKKSGFGLFVESFRKANASRQVVYEDEMRLLHKGSFVQSTTTDPTDALTVMSENTVSVASEEISNALNNTFAIFHDQHSNNHKRGENDTRQDKAVDGQFTNHKAMLLQSASLDRMAEMETASNFSDAKNRKLLSQSLNRKVASKKLQSETMQTDDTEGTEDEEESTMGDVASSVVSCFDPEQYLMELESKTSSMKTPVPSLGDDFEDNNEVGEGEVKESASGELVEVEVELQGTANVKASKVTKPVLDDDDAQTPLRSVSGSTTSDSADEWQSQASLLDVALEPEGKVHENDDGTLLDGLDDSEEQFDDNSTLGDGGSLEGPATPHSQNSSVLLEDFNEMDGLHAVADIFVNLVSCNVAELSARMVVDEEDDYSVEEEDLPDFLNGCPNELAAARRAIANRVPTPTRPSTADFWSMFNCF